MVCLLGITKQQYILDFPLLQDFQCYNLYYYSVGCSARSLRSNHVPHLRCGRLYLDFKKKSKKIIFLIPVIISLVSSFDLRYIWFRPNHWLSPRNYQNFSNIENSHCTVYQQNLNKCCIEIPATHSVFVSYMYRGHN
jgi:hypothetical protein